MFQPSRRAKPGVLRETSTRRASNWRLPMCQDVFIEAPSRDSFRTARWSSKAWRVTSSFDRDPPRVAFDCWRTIAHPWIERARTSRSVRCHQLIVKHILPSSSIAKRRKSCKRTSSFLHLADRHRFAYAEFAASIFALRFFQAVDDRKYFAPCDCRSRCASIRQVKLAIPALSFTCASG